MELLSVIIWWTKMVVNWLVVNLRTDGLFKSLSNTQRYIAACPAVRCFCVFPLLNSSKMRRHCLAKLSTSQWLSPLYHQKKHQKPSKTIIPVNGTLYHYTIIPVILCSSQKCMSPVNFAPCSTQCHVKSTIPKSMAILGTWNHWSMVILGT